MRRTVVSAARPARVRPRTETEVFALLSGAFQPFLRELSRLVTPQASEEEEGDGWIPHTRSSLGARRTRELARRGAFPGAKKVGRKWLVPRAELAAYIEREGVAPLGNDNADEGANEDVRALAADMGYALVPSPGTVGRARR